MDVTTLRRSLNLIAAGLLAGTVGAVGWSLSGPGIETGPVVASTEATTVATELRPADVDATTQNELSARALRRPLYDPPPQPVVAAPPQTKEVKPAPAPLPPLEVTLVGTMIEADQRLAIIADAKGEFDVKGVGESLELSPQGITVEQIESERVTLRYQGRTSTVQLERPRAGESGAAEGRAAPRRRNNR